MSTKQQKYSAACKAKVVLDLLGGDKTVGQICSTYNVTSKSVLAWKKLFLANATLAFNVDGAVSGVKAEWADKEKEVNELHRQLGKRTAELEWATKKLSGLSYNQKKDMVKPEHNTVSVHKQCE
jgi:transposase-like protein